MAEHVPYHKGAEHMPKSIGNPHAPYETPTEEKEKEKETPTTAVGMVGIAEWPAVQAGGKSLAEARAEAITISNELDCHWDRFDVSFMSAAQFKWASEHGFKFITLMKWNGKRKNLKETGEVTYKSEAEQKNLTEEEVKNLTKECCAWIEEIKAAQVLEVGNEFWETAEGQWTPKKYAEVWKWVLEVIHAEYPNILPLMKYWGFYEPAEAEGVEKGMMYEPASGGAFVAIIKALKTLTGVKYAEYKPTGVAVHLYNYNGGQFGTRNGINEGGFKHTAAELSKMEKSEGIWAYLPTRKMTTAEQTAFLSEHGEFPWLDTGWLSYLVTVANIRYALEGTENLSVYITETGEAVPGAIGGAEEAVVAAHTKQRIEESGLNKFIKMIMFFAFTEPEKGFYKGENPPKEKRVKMCEEFTKAVKALG